MASLPPEDQIVAATIDDPEFSDDEQAEDEVWEMAEVKQEPAVKETKPGDSKSPGDANKSGKKGAGGATKSGSKGPGDATKSGSKDASDATKAGTKALGDATKDALPNLMFWTIREGSKIPQPALRNPAGKGALAEPSLKVQMVEIYNRKRAAVSHWRSRMSITCSTSRRNIADSNSIVLDSGGIYIPVSIIDKLRSGTYDWVANSNSITKVVDLCLQCGSLCGTIFWEQVSGRPRNSIGSHRQGESERKTFKTAYVVRTNAQFLTENQGALRAEYSHMLSVSPFGDFQTWIKPAQYVSYLKGYPGYSLPTDPTLADLAKALNAMKPTKTQTAAEAKVDAAWTGRGTAALKSTGMANAGQNMTVCMVSYESITAASRAGRDSFPQQFQLMGGSATMLAQTLKWTNADARVGKVEDATTIPAKEAQDGTKTPGTTIIWDKAGVYPSEWLHRTAYSWGHASPGMNAPGPNQAKSNFVYGSSECNSLMTRYEKAFQSLFCKQAKIVAERKNLAAKSSAGQQKVKAQSASKDFSGVLLTNNTPDKMKVVHYEANGKDLKVVSVEKSSAPPPSQPGQPKGKASKVDNAVKITSNDPKFVSGDYWKVASENKNLCFALNYKLVLASENELGISTPPEVFFYPFQRGFFKKLEGAIDSQLLEFWTAGAIDKMKKAAASAADSDIIKDTGVAPMDVQKAVVPAMDQLTLTPTGAQLSNARMAISVSLPAAQSNPVSVDANAAIWQAARKGQAEAGGAKLTNVRLLPPSEVRDLARTLFAPGDVAITTSKAGEAQVLTHPTPSVASAASASNAHVPAAIAADPPLPAEVPKGFVITGSVKVFGLFDQPLYSLRGLAGVGLREIVIVQDGSIKLSDYIPGLTKSGFEAVELRNLRFIYNELTTTTEYTGTWLQADVVFSGPLQPVSDFFKNVCRQPKPMLRMQSLISARNDWTRPVAFTDLHIRGSLPDLAIKLGDIVKIAELGVGISIRRSRQPIPPFDIAWYTGLSFDGALEIDTPQQQLPMKANFKMIYDQDLLTVVVQVREDADAAADFCGVEGLKLRDIRMLSSLKLDSAPSIVAFQASALLSLRKTTLDLDGYYSKADWGFRAEVHDFTFDDLLDLYEDLFDSRLHEPTHDVQVNSLVLFASSTGLVFSGSVTIEGHTSVSATVAVSRLGLSITGLVEDVVLAPDIVLRKAGLNVSVDRANHTTATGAGASWKFAINGDVTINSVSISAALVIEKAPDGQLLWTAFGALSGTFTLSQINPDLKNTFLDLSLQDVAFIASNVDGKSAAGEMVPAAYTIVKGVQIAAKLGPIPVMVEPCVGIIMCILLCYLSRGRKRYICPAKLPLVLSCRL
ncbi:hypothetical protein BST61_g8475 [Cercospora zeina]